MNDFEIKNVLMNVKEKKPLVHCITNYVTANDCANIILALGGTPTMANLIDEVEEITSKADSLVINIGTLSKGAVESMILAGKTANKNNVPVVFDPVGAAASNSRRDSALKILSEVNVSVIRGNMAEIKAILGEKAAAKGVDSIEEVCAEKSEEIVKIAANKLSAIVAITGKKDYVSDGKRVFVIENGEKIMTRVTGTGCMTTSLIAAFLGAKDDKLMSVLAGVMCIGIAGEKAFARLELSEGSGSFRVNLIDEIYNMTAEDFKERGKINEQK